MSAKDKTIFCYSNIYYNHDRWTHETPEKTLTKDQAGNGYNGSIGLPT